MKSRRHLLTGTAVVLAILLLCTTLASAASVHTVAPGDSLSKIAPQYGITWEQLYEANKAAVKDPNLIYPGQQLVVPDAGGASASPQTSAAPAASPAASAAPAASASPAASATPAPTLEEQIGTYEAATADAFTLTVLATSDVHGNLTGWSYENGKDSGKDGFARLATIAGAVRTANPNTLLVDNGDTTQGTLLTDDLYNPDLTRPNPVVDVMNVMKYDAMVLGNHEFNFGLGLIAKLRQEADFPLLSANIYDGGGNHFATPYVVKTVNGVKVAIIGVSHPNIQVWDSAKVSALDFRSMAAEVRKVADVLIDTKQADVILCAAHAGVDSGTAADGGDSARKIAEQVPELSLLITGHDHVSLNTEINGVAVASPVNNGAELVKADLSLAKVDGVWTVASRKVSTISAGGVAQDEAVVAAAQPYHDAALAYLKNVIGTATADFHPASEVPGIPEGQIRDTAVMDLINTVQLGATGADVSAAALFSSTSNIRAGDITYASIFDIYKYPNTLVMLNVTGKELKAYMEWSAAYYNTWKPGDVTISFNPAIRSYNYDMFAGVKYQIDVSQPAGSRIVNLTFGGKAIADDQVLKLAINNYRYSGLKAAGILSGEATFNSDPKSLRAYIKDYIAGKGEISPAVDGNWSIVGANLDHPLRATIIDMVKAGTLAIPTSADGRTPNAKSLNVYELMQNGTLPQYKEINLFHTNDTHGRVKAGDGMGFAKIPTIMSAYEAVSPDALLLDIGDTFHGVNFATLTKGASVADVMNEMGYVAMAPGNHDFNYGKDRLLALEGETDFPILAANVKNADGSYFLTPYLIKEIDGVKIGFFGLATPETMYKTNPKNVEGLVFEDPAIAAKRMVAELSGKTDVIVALAHLGIEGDTTSRKLAESVSGIDVILDGHSHSVLDEVVNGTLISQTGYYDKGLGITTLLFKDGTLAMKGTALYTMADATNVKPDEGVQAIITAVDTEIAALTAEVIGTSPVALDGERANVRTKETNLANLITEAIRWKTGADCVITNGGGIRASIKAGPVTKGDILTVLPFGNYVVVKSLKGADIQAALELGVSKYPEALGGFAQVSGITFSYDSSKASGSRVTEVKIAGAPLDPAKTYTLATNDFMAAGGDNYTMFMNGGTVAEYPALDEIVIEYIKAVGFGAAVTDGRITDVAPTTSGDADEALVPAA